MTLHEDRSNSFRSICPQQMREGSRRRRFVSRRSLAQPKSRKMRRQFRKRNVYDQGIFINTPVSMVSMVCISGTCEQYVHPSVRFAVLSWKKGTRWAGWVARGSEPGARGSDGWMGESAGARHGERRAPTQRAPTQRALGDRRGPTNRAPGPTQGAPGPTQTNAGPRHRERPSPTQRAPGPDRDSERAAGPYADI